MAEGAALLVDHVLPKVGYRQWVLSFAGPLAVRLGYDQALLAAVAESLARAVIQDMRWAATESAFGMHLHAATTVDGRDHKLAYSGRLGHPFRPGSGQAFRATWAHRSGATG